MAADSEHVYVASLNAQPALELSGPKSSVAATSAGSPLGTTLVYDRNAQPLGKLVNPNDIYGRPSAVNRFSDGEHLYVTIPGCCGPGIVIYNARTLNFEQ